MYRRFTAKGRPPSPRCPARASMSAPARCCSSRDRRDRARRRSSRSLASCSGRRRGRRGSPAAEGPPLPDIRAKSFGFIFQGFNLFPALTAMENVAIAIRVKDPKARDPEKLARELLASVGLADRMHYHPANLSGGQKQRVAIARALGGA